MFQRLRWITHIALIRFDTVNFKLERMKAEFASIVLSVAGPVLSAAHDRVWFGFKSRLVYEARDGPSFPCKFTLLRITRLAGRLGCPLKYDYYYR